MSVPVFSTWIRVSCMKKVHQSRFLTIHVKNVPGCLSIVFVIIIMLFVPNIMIYMNFMRELPIFAIVITFHMNKNLSILVAALAVSGSVSAAVLDGIAAKINDLAITFDEVKMEISRNPEVREKALAAKPGDIAEIYTNAVNMLIDRKLILKSAADKKLDMQEWLVDNRIREIVNKSIIDNIREL